MQRAKPVRPRPAVDRVLLGVALACVGIGVVRFAIVLATFPYAAYVDYREQAAGASSNESIAERVARSDPWESWWGERTVPYQEGGDYLGVMSHHKTSRNIGCVLGVLTARDTARGIRIDKVVVPEDMALLYGEASGNLMVRADGTTFRTGWAPPSRDSRMFSDVPVVERTYNPVLTAEQSARLEATGGLTERSRQFLVGAPSPEGSGVWILYARLGESREYLLIPIESSPEGGAQ